MIPMAVSLGYGIVFATIITLVFVPSLYMLVEDFHLAASAPSRAMAKLRRVGTPAAQEEAGADA